VFLFFLYSFFLSRCSCLLAYCVLLEVSVGGWEVLCLSLSLWVMW